MSKKFNKIYTQERAFYIPSHARTVGSASEFQKYLGWRKVNSKKTDVLINFILFLGWVSSIWLAAFVSIQYLWIIPLMYLALSIYIIIEYIVGN